MSCSGWSVTSIFYFILFTVVLWVTNILDIVDGGLLVVFGIVFIIGQIIISYNYIGNIHNLKRIILASFLSEFFSTLIIVFTCIAIPIGIASNYTDIKYISDHFMAITMTLTILLSVIGLLLSNGIYEILSRTNMLNINLDRKNRFYENKRIFHNTFDSTLLLAIVLLFIASPSEFFLKSFKISDFNNSDVIFSYMMSSIIITYLLYQLFYRTYVNYITARDRLENEREQQ